MTVRFQQPPRALVALGTETVLYLNALANKGAAPVADLNQTISATPTQAEVQTISDKIDELLAALRAVGLLKE